VKKELKILLLADSRSFHTERFTHELRNQGCHVLVASVERGKMLHFHLVNKGGVQTKYYLKAIPRAYQIIRKFQPDIINAHFASGYGFLISLLKKYKHIPRVLHIQGSDVLLVPHISKLRHYKVVKALKEVDCVVADSEYLAQEAAKLTTIKRSEVIEWGIERKYVNFHNSDYALHTPLKIIVPRPHEKVYNNRFIIKALEPLIKEKKIEITFPEFGNLYTEFEKTCTEKNLEAVTFYSKMPRGQFMYFMTWFDVYLSASLSDSSPISLIEAMALGLIPIAADIPGVKEWLTPQNGFTFSLDDPKQLENIIIEIIDKQDPQTEIRQNNIKVAQKRGIFEENMTRQIELMRQLIEEKRVEH